MIDINRDRIKRMSCVTIYDESFNMISVLSSLRIYNKETRHESIGNLSRFIGRRTTSDLTSSLRYPMKFLIWRHEVVTRDMCLLWYFLTERLWNSVVFKVHTWSIFGTIEIKTIFRFIFHHHMKFELSFAAQMKLQNRIITWKTWSTRRCDSSSVIRDFFFAVPNLLIDRQLDRYTWVWRSRKGYE